MQLPRLIGKGDEPGGILCQLDDLLVMLREKLDRDKILFQNIGRFSHHSTGFRGASVIVTARICKPSVVRFRLNPHSALVFGED